MGICAVEGCTNPIQPDCYVKVWMEEKEYELHVCENHFCDLTWIPRPKDVSWGRGLDVI